MTDHERLFGVNRPVALVAGAGAPRVGNHVARAFAARGYQLVLHANRSAQQAQATAAELTAQGAQAIVVTAELSDEQAVRRMVEEVHDRRRRVDVFVNCAAIWSPKKLEDVTAEDIRRNLEVNTLGAFLCCQHVGLLMVAQPTGGAIVNVGDWATVRPYLHYAAYFASKGAIPTMTRDFAIELASRNPRVRVNAILPGPVMLPLDLPDEERRKSIEGTLVKREGHPRNVAHAAVFLAENDFVTGVCLPVDGGRTICVA
jgi:pteridine reductase